MLIPVEGTQPSQAELYVQKKGWSYRVANGQLNLETCPMCHKDNWHFFMAKDGLKAGLWDCKRCGEAGNLNALATKMGDRLNDVMSIQDWAQGSKPPEPLPNMTQLHADLMANEDALEYLVQRGFSMSVVQSMHLGLDSFDGKNWLVYPYYKKGQLVFAKWRTLPPANKDFRSPAGRTCPLYNEDAIVNGMESLIFVEGEGDVLSCLTQGIANVVGVPGAGQKKTEWVERIDNAAPKKIYLLYDSDTAGQKAAQEMAIKLGIDRCYNVLLPSFPHPTVPDKSGKDIGEWFQAGHSSTDFESLLSQARPFDVAGVVGVGAALEELEAELEGKGNLEPTFVSPWRELNNKFGGMEPGDLIGIMAEGKVGKTTMALNWCDWLSRQGTPTLLYCQEMPCKRLARKWAAYVTQTDDTPGRSGITADTIRAAKKLALDYPADLLLGYTRGHKPDHVFDVIRQAVRRYGVRVVAFDNLQFLSRSISNQTAELNSLGKRFKELAMELNIVVLLIIQPNRVRDGEIVASRNAAGSSAIEKDVDSMICLHRNRVGKIKQEDFKGFMDGDENFEPQMLVRVDLSRYASGGFCTLMVDGGRSTIRDFEASEIPNLAPVSGTIPVEV